MLKTLSCYKLWNILLWTMPLQRHTQEAHDKTVHTHLPQFLDHTSWHHPCPQEKITTPSLVTLSSPLEPLLTCTWFIVLFILLPNYQAFFECSLCTRHCTRYWDIKHSVTQLQSCSHGAYILEGKTQDLNVTQPIVGNPAYTLGTFSKNTVGEPIPINSDLIDLGWGLSWS